MGGGRGPYAGGYGSCEGKAYLATQNAFVFLAQKKNGSWPIKGKGGRGYREEDRRKRDRVVRDCVLTEGQKDLSNLMRERG